MYLLKEMKEALLQLLYPHICAGCGNDQLPAHSQLCLHCLHHLPDTKYGPVKGNPVEKVFYGRLPVEQAMAAFYFTKASVMQHLLHALKYQGNAALGIQLGHLLGERILAANRFSPDALVPLPLYARKEKERGYNQATLLCQGMAEVLKLPVYDHVVSRPEHTATQTHKSRVERWQNMEGRFRLDTPDAIRAKHILLVDDVITTGATLESCGEVLRQDGETRISVAALCYASR